MKKYVIMALALLGMASCSEKKFHVEGNITEAQDSVLYLENVGISEITPVDSVKLSADGSFSFSGEATEAPSSTDCASATRLSTSPSTLPRR